MGKKAFNFRDLQFRYSKGQYPEKVDYEGQVKQFELAKKFIYLMWFSWGEKDDDHDELKGQKYAVLPVPIQIVHNSYN